MASFFKKVGSAVESAFEKAPEERHSHSHLGAECGHLHPEDHTANRFHSFAPESSGNIKWFVDGCSYFWAVSEALEQAQESIWILDWWLTPELPLRRPLAKNEQYRLDHMLKAAAERGVMVNIIIYKEVEAALSINSAFTRQTLEKLHPNIKVFRHPDHVPNGYDITQELGKSIKQLTTFDLAKASGDAVKSVYGTSDDIVLYWAHHEKLIVIDRKLVFMGGLDLCFGRWDTNSHPIADCHPGDLDAALFVGQEFNNARVYDFANLNNWQENKLDRTKSSRMGWSDVALSMNGPIVDSLVYHFVDRWNFLWTIKYSDKNGKYQELKADPPVVAPPPEEHHTHRWRQMAQDNLGGLTEQFNRGLDMFTHGGDGSHHGHHRGHQQHENNVPVRIQLTRSCCEWSSGHKTEHSISNAYMRAIQTAEKFVYIENQFFITATDDKQQPVTNKIGAVIVDRIVQAHEANEKFMVIVLMPAVPAFAGDLKADDSIGTRAIMEFQYNSICRGGYSIIEKLQKAGIDDPSQYITFYNLRNFDRINTSTTLSSVQSRAGVSYEEAREEHDSYYGGREYPDEDGRTHDRSKKYQSEARNVDDKTLDTISSCYMDGGRSVVDIPWYGNPDDEMNSFVSEELYIHTKLLIADDRLVICGSANLNDRSQLGTHDSEIAVVIEDPTPVETTMDGEPFIASRFAASLRRFIFRKHLGLLPDQRWDEPNQNWHPIDRSPNNYDWGSPADSLVRDPLSHNFQNLWKGTAKTNTETFSRAFHPVPNDLVKNWNDYKEFFSKHFIIPGKKMDEDEKKGKVEYGHIVPEEFPGGVQEVKEWLSRIRGNLVEMPLQFLVEEDIAKEGLSFNSLTDEIYT